MDLKFKYFRDLLAGANPKTLALFYWNPATTGAFGPWHMVDSSVSLRDRAVVASTKLFATYALFSMPRWQTKFGETQAVDGTLSQGYNFSVTGELVLKNTPGDAVVATFPITPSFGLSAWESVFYSVTNSPPNT